MDFYAFNSSLISSTRCNVRSLWDLWWFGDLSGNVTPYRKFRSFDLATKEARALMSKATRVMETLEKLAKVDNASINLGQLSMIESRDVFATTFLAVCHSFHTAPVLPLEELDKRHYGTKSYLTFYDLIGNLRKRNLEQMQS